ncbi:M15 family metallopeptidase [Achromobacter sp. JUb104]|uniref:M15 family metallopeptidase n=1 Tax=Achromobacter sp. JUb104 TaxID=2940590 RepID=UPI002166F0D5|nr:M15 family metallopeptidase [Achromobacter sp. JUb104]MCS3505459.1 peptidoglycan L-alanyl-D-glutamate endopeptidase CwlK [Achromobacter sp. JUb104]
MGVFVLSAGSKKELLRVHEALVSIVEKAVQLSVQEFAVHDGIRTIAEQQQMVQRGASQTLDSRHVSGHAVDLVPYINGKLRWEWPPIYLIADAMRIGAQELKIPLRWGGAWDVDFTNSTELPEDLVANYVARRKKQGLSAFIDGPHFELQRSQYP